MNYDRPEAVGAHSDWYAPMNTMGENTAPTPDNSGLADKTDNELFQLWADVMAEFRRRGLTRTANNPVADYAEHLVAKQLQLTLQSNSKAGYDAVGPDGIRYQIKARRMTRPRPSLQLGMLRNLQADEFDVLAIVLFGPRFEMLGIWSVPIAVVREYASYHAHVNAHILHARQSLLNDERVTKLQ
jgi:hypothetical protein